VHYLLEVQVCPKRIVYQADDKLGWPADVNHIDRKFEECVTGAMENAKINSWRWRLLDLKPVRLKVRMKSSVKQQIAKFIIRPLYPTPP